MEGRGTAEESEERRVVREAGGVAVMCSEAWKGTVGFRDGVEER